MRKLNQNTSVRAEKAKRNHLERYLRKKYIPIRTAPREKKCLVNPCVCQKTANSKLAAKLYNKTTKALIKMKYPGVSPSLFCDLFH